MLLTSLKPMAEIRAGNILTLPVAPTLEPWHAAWSTACVGVECIGINGFYANTFIIAMPAVIIATADRRAERLRADQVPLSRPPSGVRPDPVRHLHALPVDPHPDGGTLGSLGLSGTLVGLVFVHTIYGLPFTTVFARSFYINVPQDLVKAGEVDGAGFFRIFWSVMLPISAPILIVSVIWMFTNIWNDFLFGSAYAFGSNAPIMVALNNIVNTSTGEKPYNVHMASAMLAAVPTLILYVVAGKYFIRGLMSGSVKG